MPDWLADLLLKAGPYTNYVLLGVIVWIGWQLESIKKSYEKQADAQLQQVQATSLVTEALKAINSSVIDLARNNTEVLRMMDKFQAAEGERHGTNVNTLAQLSSMMLQLLTRKDEK